MEATSLLEDSPPYGKSNLRIAVILNPAAGRGEGRRRRREIEAALSTHGDSWQIIETTRQGSAEEQAAAAVRDGADVVAAAGGDGTLNEILNGIVGTDAALGLIPLGTGNDFGRHMGINRGVASAAANLFTGKRHPVDVGIVHGKYFLNIAGCGFDAAVAQRINEGYRMLRGTTAYVAAIVETLAKYRAAEMTLTIDGESRQVNAMLCSIANASSYGGGMKIAPSAAVDDGLFDVCVLHKVGKLDFLRSFPKVFKGTHTTHPKMEIVRGKQVRIESARKLPILIDGEVRGTTPVVFTLKPQAIEFVAPARSPESSPKP